MRRLYKLLSWDYETHRGYATDGTSYDFEPFKFTIMENDLEPEHNNHLLLDEIFSAEESPNHLLFDIIIEEGPRSFKELSKNLRPHEDEIVNGNVVDPPSKKDINWSTPSIDSRVFELERKMEYLINRFGDDGK